MNLDYSLGREKLCGGCTRLAAGGPPLCPLGARAEAEADYILSTFPIVREKDLAAFGSFRTRDWILAYRQRIDDGVLSHQNLHTSAVQ